MSALMQKAERAAASARLLLEAGDLDGACNRAYYAMFDAARAVLFAADVSVGAEEIRTHGGLITAFSLHFVKTGRIPLDLGRALNKVQELRLTADYLGASVDDETAAWAVDQAEVFVSHMRAVMTSSP